MLYIKLLVNNLFYIGSIKKLINNLKSYKSIKDNLRFAFFMALMNSSYKFILCLLRRYNISDKIAAPIAGFIAGLSIKIDVKHRRIFIMMLLMSRVLDTMVNLMYANGLKLTIP